MDLGGQVEGSGRNWSRVKHNQNILYEINLLFIKMNKKEKTFLLGDKN